MFTPNCVYLGKAGRGVILAASALVKTPGTNPYRHVVIDHGDEYTVHTQSWLEMPEDPSNPKGSSLMYGHYFRKNDNPGEAFVKAMKRFCEKVAEHSEYMVSVYR